MVREALRQRKGVQGVDTGAVGQRLGHRIVDLKRRRSGQHDPELAGISVVESLDSLEQSGGLLGLVEGQIERPDGAPGALGLLLDRPLQASFCADQPVAQKRVVEIQDQLLRLGNAGQHLAHQRRLARLACT